MRGMTAAGIYAGQGYLVVRRAFPRAEVEPLLAWDQVTRGPTTHDYRDIIMVSGKDPYAYKGVEDISHAYLRKSGPTPADLAEADEHVEWNAA